MNETKKSSRQLKPRGAQGPFTAHFKESMALLAPIAASRNAADDSAGLAAAAGWLWRIRVLRFGLSKNRFLWTRPVIEQAAALFDGVRVYADHQDPAAARAGKPRSVRELVGFLREPVVTDDGLEALLRVLESEDWLRRKLLAVHAPAVREGEALHYQAVQQHELVGSAAADGLPQRRGAANDLLGFSVDALVDYEPRPDPVGAGMVFEVKKIREVVSVDVVTTPSAGGRVLRLVAGTPGWAQHLRENRDPKSSQSTQFHLEREFHKEEAMTERVQKILEAVGRMNPALAVSLAQELDGTDEAIALDRVLEEMSQQTQIHAPATPTPAAELTGSVARAVEAAERATAAERRTLLAARLAESKLPVPLQRDIERRFTSRTFTPVELDREIQAVRETFAQLLPDTRVGPARGGISVGYSPGDKMQIALDKAFGLSTDDQGRTLDPAVPAFGGLREAYIAMTGDSEFTGRTQHQRITEIFSTAGFPAALANTLNRRLRADYREVDYGVEKIARFAAVSDFKTQERVLVGYFGDLPAVNPETADYAEIAPFTDEKVSYAVVQFGGIVTVTRKMIVNDDIGTVAKIVGRLGRAARRTLAKRVWNLLITNATYDPDGLAIFHATHLNLGSTALSVTALTAAIDAMMKQTEKDSNERLGIAPRFLGVPIDLRAKAFEINQSRLVPGSTANDANEHFERFGRESERVIVNPLFTDANDWYLVADPAEMEGLEVGFLQGRVEPELFLADAPTDAQVFVADKIRYKIRHEYEADLLDYRAFYKSVVV